MHGEFPNHIEVGYGAAFAGCGGLIENNIITGSLVKDRGSAFYQCNGRIRNNTVVGNWGPSVIDSCSAFIDNNIFYQGENPPYLSIVGDFVEGMGLNLIQGIGETDERENFDLPPLFVDEAGGDFRLQPHSPCIDRGGDFGSTVDYDGNPRGVDGSSRSGYRGGETDIGAFEYQGPYVRYGDLTADGDLDPLDLFVFQKGWMSPTAPSAPSDLNWDRKVDSKDLLILRGE